MLAVAGERETLADAVRFNRGKETQQEWAEEVVRYMLTNASVTVAMMRRLAAAANASPAVLFDVQSGAPYRSKEDIFVQLRKTMMPREAVPHARVTPPKKRRGGAEQAKTAEAAALRNMQIRAGDAACGAALVAMLFWYLVLNPDSQYARRHMLGRESALTASPHDDPILRRMRDSTRMLPIEGAMLNDFDHAMRDVFVTTPPDASLDELRRRLLALPPGEARRLRCVHLVRADGEPRDSRREIRVALHTDWAWSDLPGIARRRWGHWAWGRGGTRRNSGAERRHSSKII